MTKLAVIGIGNMGTYTATALAPKAEMVSVYDSKKGPAEIADALRGVPNLTIASSYQQAVEGTDAVVFCVPTDVVGEVMQQTLPYCRSGTLISGQTSRKTPEAEAFRRFSGAESGLEFVTIHTLCNPKSSDPSKEILGIIRDVTTTDGAYRRAMELYGDLSSHVEEFASIEEHDTITARTQIDTSRTFLSIASSFVEAERFPWLEGGYNSPLDVIKFALAIRAASLPGHVYRGVQFGSPHGKKIVGHAIKIERELFELILGDRFPVYRSRVLGATDVILKGRGTEPILSEAALKEFGDEAHSTPNSHFSIIQYAVALAESGHSPFEDLKATTPMHTSLLCIMDSLLRDDAVLEKSMAAPFANAQLRVDDLIFHDETQGWASALLFDNGSLYDNKHQRMTGRLDDQLVKVQLEKSSPIVRMCRESMERQLMKRK